MGEGPRRTESLRGAPQGSRGCVVMSTPAGERLARIEERVEGMQSANAREHLLASADREDTKREIEEVRKTLENLTSLLDQAKGARFIIGFIVACGAVIGGVVGSKFGVFLWQSFAGKGP